MLAVVFATRAACRRLAVARGEVQQAEGEGRSWFARRTPQHLIKFEVLDHEPLPYTDMRVLQQAWRMYMLLGVDAPSNHVIPGKSLAYVQLSILWGILYILRLSACSDLREKAPVQEELETNPHCIHRGTREAVQRGLASVWGMCLGEETWDRRRGGIDGPR